MKICDECGPVDVKVLYRIFGKGLYCKFHYWFALYGSEPPSNWRISADH